MTEPKQAGDKPVVMVLKSDTYFWCSCGESRNQPFCDGSHKGTDFQPVKFEITDEKQYALCTCKRTANKPYCDGAHKRI